MVMNPVPPAAVLTPETSPKDHGQSQTVEVTLVYWTEVDNRILQCRAKGMPYIPESYDKVEYNVSLTARIVRVGFKPPSESGIRNSHLP